MTTLDIGLIRGLSPFQISLESLTRGLAVVGQSGCGKSFLMGRLLEELVSRTSDKTSVVVVDTNSDYYQGFTPKLPVDFDTLLEEYRSGGSGTNFREFKDREEKAHRHFSSLALDCILFGRGVPFNLPTHQLLSNSEIFSSIMKGDSCPNDYSWAHIATDSLLKDPRKIECEPSKWIEAALEILDLRQGKRKKGFKYIDVDPTAESVLGLVSDGTYVEFVNDLGSLASSEIWRKKKSDVGIPEKLFTKSRLVILETEPIKDRKDKIRVVTMVLENIRSHHIQMMEELRALEPTTESTKRQTQQDNLKHTFIVIDEAQNFAPREPSSSLEHALGELIHTIAAEGRKYGLHLILGTQRPNKLKSGLLGELDNAIVMKMNSKTDLEWLASEMRILDYKLLEPTLHFYGKGNAIALGEMTEMAPFARMFQSAPRRTIEGGDDIKAF